VYYKRRVCAFCGREFYATSPGQKYCSSECRKEAYREKRRKYHRSRVERGRDVSPRAKPGDKCTHCGFDVHYALEFSHEVNGFLCANCHRKLHLKIGRKLSLTDWISLSQNALYDPE